MFGYSFVAFASLGIAVLGFLVWGHHMFVAGQSVYAALIFSILSFLVVGFVAWRLSRMLLPKEGEKPATKVCTYCRMGDVDPAATRCPHCTSQLAG